MLNNKRLTRYLILFFFLISLILLLFIGREAWRWGRFLSTPIVPPGKEFIYILKPGFNMAQVAYDLNQQGYLKNPDYLMRLASWTGHLTKLKAGEYQFKGGIKPWGLLQQIAAGKVMQHTITFVEGWTFAQIHNRLNLAPSLTHHTLTMSPKLVMRHLKTLLSNQASNNPEGLFYPDTYQYTYGTTDLDILKISYRLMQQKLAQLWPTRVPNLPYKTPYEALIVASLIEKEAKHPEDRPLIASVIVNRLQKNMPLQIDATIIYARGANYHMTIKAKDLAYVSPYNTYQRQGLPPTPICMPSFASLQAALHPANTDKLYYVAKSDGKHVFSNTLTQHHAAVTKYLRQIPKTAFERAIGNNVRLKG